MYKLIIPPEDDNRTKYELFEDIINRDLQSLLQGIMRKRESEDLLGEILRSFKYNRELKDFIDGYNT